MVDGDISAPAVVINGVVNGDVRTSKHVELAAKGAVSGNAHCHFIEMVKGAQENGQLVFVSAAVQPEKSVSASKGDTRLAAVANT